uniref:Peptidase_M14 domain-containing protein n=1 Tax=Onchocerca flexuosa TaxID=387005 RepID=A0A183I5Y4_9BILA
LLAFKNIASIISENKSFTDVLDKDNLPEFKYNNRVNVLEKVENNKGKIGGTYSILRIIPENIEQLKFLSTLYVTDDGMFHQFILILTANKYLRSKQEILPRRNKSFNEDRRLWDDNNRKSNIFLGEYHSFDGIISWLKNLEKQNPKIVTVISIGTTYEGRKIYGVKV